MSFMSGILASPGGRTIPERQILRDESPIGYPNPHGPDAFVYRHEYKRKYVILCPLGRQIRIETVIFLNSTSSMLDNKDVVVTNNATTPLFLLLVVTITGGFYPTVSRYGSCYYVCDIPITNVRVSSSSCWLPALFFLVNMYVWGPSFVSLTLCRPTN